MGVRNQCWMLYCAMLIINYKYINLIYCFWCSLFESLVIKKLRTIKSNCVSHNRNSDLQ